MTMADKTLRMAVDALIKERRLVAFDANLFDLRLACTPHAKRCSDRRKEIDAAIVAIANTGRPQAKEPPPQQLEMFFQMSIETAVANIIAASKKLSTAARPVMEGWLRDQSKGVASRIDQNDLQTWLSGLHPDRVKHEHDWVLAQVNYLTWLLPEAHSKKEGTHE